LKEEFNSSLFTFEVESFERKTQNPLHEDLLFSSLWELQPWDYRKVDLVGSSSGRPWIAVVFGYFYEFFISWFRFPLFPFGCEVRLSHFIVSSLF
jgi:hypothetical protein